MNRLSGIIKGAELAQPIPDVQVFHVVEGKTKKQVGTSNENGHWEVTEELNRGALRFEKTGFASKRFPVDEVPDLVRLLEDKLIGYQDRLWYHAGNDIKAYIHAPEPYEATLYRHGLKKEKLLTVENQPAFTQEIPDGLFVKDGLDWETSFSYQVPEDASPGIYSLLLESEHQEPFAIPFVVSTPTDVANRKPLLVLASTNNWQCYNIWGGRSRYRNFEEDKSSPYLRDPSKLTELLAYAGKLAPDPLVRAIKGIIGMPQSDPPWKFKRLSINRPFTNCALEGDTPSSPFTNHLAGGEWRVLAWLEREGYEYDVVSGYELHQNPGILRNYEGIILSTHCEYWSKPMYQGLKESHQNHGLSIINLSGNTMYREVDFYQDGSLHCTSLKFEKSVADETQLLGVRFTEGDLGTAAPYQVRKQNHWVFEQLDMKKGQFFGEDSLNHKTPQKRQVYDPGRLGTVSGLKGHGASGWETDKLSHTAPGDFTLVAKGQNRGGGADMVIREAEGSRGGVFSASSITFGGSLLIDEVCSGIVKNVLKRFL
ncbi:hypothetical protein NC796_23130 [Aliifodinibius sp. S!AR15-10]|uniref:N,N-dimethylformamidase beta subunit family domain-containing protein n=1 Tax=Aliifodinibius sp. S!AR15-10 TaxID=2950437 RepID=UPI00286052E0|nr:N,N-dimethylformamidase beta subunit family domain-containing protein [Aliifodinibius sp. S!AR15-10]MDR8394066.1 hypothetical protein [Aliifodinibius sp. S!AR15-10]